ncbi:MAG: hypothetical protein QF814_07510 [Candidatus Marinimicrobia bacterium]|jgi:hypothetical protein|nr:hypothetical protein [Candidatus Neomarinimicrobiota bacterium]HJM47296.1 hypothetical protein [Candidatus Neomarinimicrobiota bacterium]|tara:strand:+ start:10150 stop:11853 length:1704 start_codon:yes stop_codon:yes gene_type:complete
MKYSHWFWFGINVVTQLLAQSLTPIPFDWSGQNGISSYGGLLLWNRDWNSNELFFDGTFQSYPQRFGGEIVQDATLSYTYAFRNILFPDSAEIHTSFDYRQGDHLYDQLNIHADFSQPNRIMKWNGFKRSYGGPLSQFIQPQPENQSTRSLTPNQQSYLFYYLSKMNNRISVLSIGRFITDSGLYNFSEEQNGRHTNEITSASFSVHAEWQQFHLRFRVAQYLENRLWNTIFSLMPRHYLSRGLYEGILSPSVENVNFPWQVGVSAHNQALIFSDSTISKYRKWFSFWGSLTRERFQVNGGIDTEKETVLPRFSITINRNSRSVKWVNEVGMKNIPQHMVSWTDSSRLFFESWITMKSHLVWENEKLAISGGVSSWHVNSILDYNPDSLATPRRMFSFHCGLLWESIYGFRFSSSWQHSSKEPLLSDGIGDHIKTKLEYTQSLFSDKMLLTAGLTVEGLLNRDSSSVFYPELQRLFKYPNLLHNNLDLIKNDYWIAHLLISAKISTVTISYRMQNLFNIQENMFRQLNPDLPDEWVNPRNNVYFHSKGLDFGLDRLVSFEVEWEFED